ncbi:MAG: hypothetical protein MHPSP_003022 [Paramarteilia canceri]
MVKSETMAYNKIKIPVPGSLCEQDVLDDVDGRTLAFVRGITLDRPISADVYVCTYVRNLGTKSGYMWGYVATEDIKSEKVGVMKDFTDSLDYLIRPCNDTGDKLLWCDDGRIFLGNQVCLKEGEELDPNYCLLSESDKIVADEIIKGSHYPSEFIEFWNSEIKSSDDYNEDALSPNFKVKMDL